MSQSNGGLEDILNSPQVAQLLKNKTALMSLLNSPDGKRLAQMLSQAGDGKLQNAAQSASHGDTSAAASLLNALKNNPEGAAILERLSKQIIK